ncbi:MAG TPA: hypothetical protein VH796_06020 [Nitrososphaeraceae archaeon]
MGKNGIWSAISFIDENGSFRGEARFDTEHEARTYLMKYTKKIKKHLDLKVFEE